MNLTELLTTSIQHGASDLHISAGLPPMIRVDGELRQLPFPPLSLEQAIILFQNEMTPAQIETFATNHEIDFALQLADLARVRINYFRQHRGVAGVLRIIPAQVLNLEQLSAPKILQEVAMLSQGLVLVTGATGSGKSTTLAALIDYINARCAHHIITIEDPIEFLHSNKLSLIHQREIQRDTISFANALRSALRADPDILLIGELRDAETIRMALTAAETGHLVFATLHTNSAAKAIHRIIDVFPGDEKAMVCSLLAESLQAVICQQLFKKICGGRVAAFEIMLATPAIRNLIREDKIAQMVSTMQTSAALGMQTLDQQVRELVNKKIIDVV